MKLQLVSVGNRKIEAIKLVRDLSGLSLQDCKRIVDNPMSFFEINQSDSKFQDIEKQFNDIGAFVIHIQTEEKQNVHQPVSVQQTNRKFKYKVSFLTGNSAIDTIRLLRKYTEKSISECKKIADNKKSFEILAESWAINQIVNEFNEFGNQLTFELINEDEAPGIIEKTMEQILAVPVIKPFKIKLQTLTNKKLEAIKLIRTLRNDIKLKDAKDLVETQNAEFTALFFDNEIEKVSKRFNAIGINVQIEEDLNFKDMLQAQNIQNHYKATFKSSQNKTSNTKKNQENKIKTIHDKKNIPITENKTISTQAPVVQKEELDKKYAIKVLISEQNNKVALTTGFLVAIIWGIMSDYMIAHFYQSKAVIMSISGLFIGYSMRYFGKTIEEKYRQIAVWFTVFSILVYYSVSILFFNYRFTEVPFDFFVIYFKAYLTNYINYLYIIIAIYLAYKFSVIPLNAKNLEAASKRNVKERIIQPVMKQEQSSTEVKRKNADEQDKNRFYEKRSRSKEYESKRKKDL